VDKKRSLYNKKKWLRNYSEEILRLKQQGSTYQVIIQHLTEQHEMPFDLSESLLSRYLKEFAEDKSNYKKVDDKLHNRIERKNDRLAEKNHEIQNLKRRLERTLERNLHFDVENECLKDRNRILEDKFLDGEARFKNLERYKGLHNVRQKFRELEEKNDDFFQTILSLERRCESLAEPHEKANEQIEILQAENKRLKHDFDLIQAELEESKQSVRSLSAIQHLKEKLTQLNAENKALSSKLTEAEIALQQKRTAELVQEYPQMLNPIVSMKLHIKRLQSDLKRSEGLLRETANELSNSEISAKKDRFLAYSFMFMCLVLLVFLFI
jgi:regulator of replication initiation timing